jgi:hypothetical protein
MMHPVDLLTGKLARDGICKMKIHDVFREVLTPGTMPLWMLNDKNEGLMKQDVLSSPSHMRAGMDHPTLNSIPSLKRTQRNMMTLAEPLWNPEARRLVETYPRLARREQP